MRTNVRLANAVRHCPDAPVDRAGASPAPPRRLLDAALAATAAERGAEEELRLAVCEHTRALRAAGLPPERVLVLMKTAMAHAGLAHSANDLERALLASVVRWCIGEYYAPADR